MPYKLFCLMSGDSECFSVEIDETHRVEDLKEKIKTKREITFNAAALTIYKIEIEISDDDEYTRITNLISQGDYDFPNKQRLSPSRKISMAFGGDLDETIEVLVELPPGHATSRTTDRSVNIKECWAKPIDADNDHEVQRHLQTPLTEEEKIPITQQQLGDMVKTGGDDPLREQDLATLFRVSREDSAEELYRHLWVRVINRKPHPRGTEASFHSFWDDVIGHTLQLILKCGFIRDSNHETSTDLQRPDYGLMLGSLCVFRGEEKPPDSQEKPINELREKVRWESTALPYILGYGAIGPDIKLVMIAPGPLDTVILASHDLKLAKERIRCFIHLIRLSGIIARLAQKFGHQGGMEFKIIEREHSFAEIEFGGGSVKKIFKRPDACDHVAHLFNIYRHLKAKSVPHSDFLKATSIKPGDCSITTSPVGDSRWPKDSRELHTALVCILSALEKAHAEPNPIYHRDIWWSNIIKEFSSDNWFLIDWSDATLAPTKAVEHLDPETHSPNLRVDNHGADVDIWGVAHYMSTLAKKWKMHGVEVIAKRWKTNTSLTAESALAEIQREKHLFMDVEEHVSTALLVTNLMWHGGRQGSKQGRLLL